MLFHKTKRRQPSLLSRCVMVSTKTFTAYHFVYELANYSSAKKNFARLLNCPVFSASKGSEISEYFLRLVFAKLKSSFRLDLKRWKKPPEKTELANDVP